VSARFDVIVVGGGAMGTAAARNLALRGRETLLLERFGFGHANGSSGGPTRIFRYAYHSAGYVRMAMQARPAWDELQDAAGEELLRETGGLDVGPPAVARGDLLDAAGIPSQRLTPADVAERWPSLRVPAGADVLFQPEGGVLRAARTVEVQAKLAADAGADVRQEAPVRSVHPTSRGVEVVIEHGESFTAPVAVVAVGAWAGPLLRAAGLDLPLRPSLEQASYFRLGDARALPTLIDWLADDARPPYVVPDPFEPTSPGTAFKVGLHMAGPAVDTETRTFDPDPVRVEAVRSYVRDTIHGARDLARTDTCLYTVTPDEDFVLDRVGPLVVASPCSGHGFKFVPLFGRAIADLATGGEPLFPLEPFRADRPSLQRAR
jgi:sarcosine oxidase